MASDAFSSIVGLLLMGTGNDNNSWGDNANNSVFKILEKAIAGSASHAVTGGTLDLSTSPPPAGPTAALEMIQLFSGTLTANQIVQVPNLPKIWLVSNSCTGAFTMKFKTPSGTASLAIPQGGVCFVACDGGDGIAVGLSTTLRDVQFLGSDGTLAKPALSFTNEPGSGVFRKSNGVLGVAINGVEIATLSATGLDVDAGLAITVGGVGLVPAGTEVATAAIRAPTGWYFEYGQTVTRSGDAALLAALTEGFTANTNGTTTLSNVSKDLTNLGLEGSTLEGVGIFTGATIVSITSTTIVMSNAATNTATGGAVTAFPYGNGDGVTTFKLPDARGTVAAGRDNMGGTAANNLTTAGSGVNGLQLKTLGGAQNVTLDITMIPSHDHGGVTGDTQPTATVSGGTIGGQNNGSGGSVGSVPITPAPIVVTISAHHHSIPAQGGGSAHNNVQPTRIRNVIIKR